MPIFMPKQVARKLLGYQYWNSTHDAVSIKYLRQSVTLNKNRLLKSQTKFGQIFLLLIKKATVSQTNIGFQSLFHIFAPAFLLLDQPPYSIYQTR